MTCSGLRLTVDAPKISRWTGERVMRLALGFIPVAGTSFPTRLCPEELEPSPPTTVPQIADSAVADLSADLCGRPRLGRLEAADLALGIRLSMSQWCS